MRPEDARRDVHFHQFLRNTIIVAGVGAGMGAVIGAALHRPCSSQSFCLDIGGAALPGRSRRGAWRRGGAP
jgi:hypothetical protein